MSFETDLQLTMWEMLAKYLQPMNDGTCHLCLPSRRAVASVMDYANGHLVDIPMCQEHLERIAETMGLEIIRKD